MIGFVGVMLVFCMSLGDLKMLVGFELGVILVCVLGGVLFMGGVVIVFGVLVGVLIMGLV